MGHALQVDLRLRVMAFFGGGCLVLGVSGLGYVVVRIQDHVQ